jgi:nucleoside 2-deoxyribosyltransferase
MDGADPDSGTCWECGYAYGRDKPTILFRTDARSERNIDLGPYNLMMWASATVHLDGLFPSVTALASAIIPVLDQSTLTRQVSKRREDLQITG